jgi:hypothetical protein
VRFPLLCQSCKGLRFCVIRRRDYCHENGESAHEKSKTYEQLAIFMLRGAPEAHAACCKIAISLIDLGLADLPHFIFWRASGALL